MDSREQSGARAGANDDLPGIATGGVFVESGSGFANRKRSVLDKGAVVFSGVFNRGLLGTIGDVKFGDIVEGWKMAFSPLGNDVAIEGIIVVLESGSDNRMIRLVSLDKNVGGV